MPTSEGIPIAIDGKLATRQAKLAVGQVRGSRNSPRWPNSLESCLRNVIFGQERVLSVDSRLDTHTCGHSSAGPPLHHGEWPAQLSATFEDAGLRRAGIAVAQGA